MFFLRSFFDYWSNAQLEIEILIYSYKIKIIINASLLLTPSQSQPTANCKLRFLSYLTIEFYKYTHIISDYFILLQGRQIEFGSNVRYVGYSSQDWSGWKICLSSFGHPTGSIVQRMSNFVWVSYQTVFSGIWCFQRRQLYWRYIFAFDLFCSPDPTINSKIKNPNHEFLYERVLKIFVKIQKS